MQEPGAIISHGITENELTASTRNVHCPTCGTSLGLFNSDDPENDDQYWMNIRCAVCDVQLSIHMHGRLFRDVSISFPEEPTHGQTVFLRPHTRTRYQIFRSGIVDIWRRFKMMKGS